MPGRVGCGIGGLVCACASVAAVTLTYTAFNGFDPEPLLLVQCQFNNLTSLISSASYGGVALHRIRNDVSSLTGDSLTTWYLMNPGAGSNQLIVTFNTASAVHMGVISYAGVYQPGPIGSQAFISNGASAAQTISITTNASNSVIADVLDVGANGIGVTPGAGQTQRWNAVDHTEQFHILTAEKLILEYPDQWLWMHKRWKAT